MNGSALIVIVLAVLGSIFVDSVPDAVSLAVGFTALAGGAAHYGAVLADASERAVKRATAYGFFIGALLSALALVVDALA